jgi:hypothetical protein
MTTSVRAKLPNAIFLVLGSDTATLPDATAVGLSWASKDALIVGGTNDMDGETTISVDSQAPARELIQLETHVIQCDSGSLSLETVLGDEISRYQVPVGSVEIIVFVDDLAEPGTVHLQVG